MRTKACRNCAKRMASRSRARRWDSRSARANFHCGACTRRKAGCSSAKSSPNSTDRTRRRKKAGCSSARNFPNSTGRTRRTNCPDYPTRNFVPVRGWTTRCCRRRGGVCSLRSWWMCLAKGGSRPKGCGCRRRCCWPLRGPAAAWCACWRRGLRSRGLCICSGARIVGPCRS